MDNLIDKAQHIHATLQYQLTGIGRRADLTPHERLAAVGKYRADYEQRLATLRDAATKRIEAARAALAERRAEHIEDLRLILGDGALLRIYELRLRALDANAMLRSLADAQPGWEAALIQQLGAAILAERAATGDADAAATVAQFDRQPAIEAERAALAAAVDSMGAFEPTPWPVTWEG